MGDSMSRDSSCVARGCVFGAPRVDVVAARRGDVAACEDFVRRALETIEEQLLPRSAFTH